MAILCIIAISRSFPHVTLEATLKNPCRNLKNRAQLNRTEIFYVLSPKYTGHGQICTDLPRMYLWRNFEDSIPYGNLETELNTKGDYFILLLCSILCEIQVKLSQKAGSTLSN